MRVKTTSFALDGLWTKSSYYNVLRAVNYQGQGTKVATL